MKQERRIAIIATGGGRLRQFASLLFAAFNGPAAAPVKKPWRMEKKSDSADVYLYDVIGDSWDGTTAKQFSIDLKALGPIKVLNVFINSIGGSVFDGVGIYNQLRRHPAEVHVHIDGVAASIASVIAMAGKTRTIAKNGMIMIHDPWAFAMGTEEELMKAVEMLKKTKETIVDTYASATDQDPDTIRTWMKEETWFTADEALDAGFVDVVGDSEVELAAIASHEFKAFKNLPANLRSMIEVAARAKETPAPAAPAAAGAPAPAVTAPAPHPALARVRSQIEHRQWASPRIAA